MRAGAAPLPAVRAPLRPRAASRLAAVALLTTLTTLTAGLSAGCGAEAGSDPAGTPASSAPPATTSGTDARTQLAALAAAAQDRHLVARYTLSVAGRPDRTVTVTSARDRSWRVDIPGGALGGTADVSVVQTSAGLFQCALGAVPQAVPTVEGPSCVRVAGPGRRMPAAADPRVQHPFTDWREVLTDRRAPLSVSVGRPLPGVGGTCFSVDSTTASLSPPLDVGIYCYDPDGTLTGARLAYGTLALAGAPAAGPASATLPGPVVDRDPLGMEPPPPPAAPTDPGNPADTLDGQ